MTLLFLFVVGVGLLVVGADRLVVGASSIARRFGLSQLVIGLTIVALGTSAPELFVSVISAVKGNADISLGNVVGSNICNLLLILGITGLIIPLLVTPRIVSFDAPVMILGAILLYVLGSDGVLTLIDGVFFFAFAIIYLAISACTVKSTPDDGAEAPPLSTPVAIVVVVFGLICLVGGSQLILNSAVALAQFLGVSELVIGLTIVAVGTSLPEIATSVLAALRGEADLAVGNIVGSNILNVLFILGASALISPLGIAVSEVALNVDMPIMVAVSILSLPLFWTHSKITRTDSAVLLAGYILYTAYLIVDATSPEQLVVIYAISGVYLAFSAVVVIRGVFSTIKNRLEN